VVIVGPQGWACGRGSPRPATEMEAGVFPVSGTEPEADASALHFSGTVGCMSRVLPPLDAIISSLLQQLAYGKAHLRIAKGLAESDPVVLNAAKTFFAMTIDSHVYMAQMHAARLHDDQNRAVTVSTLLDRAEKEAGTAKVGTASEVRSAIKEARTSLAAHAASLKALDTRRNTWLAHNDPRTLTDPVMMAEAAKLSFTELDRIFNETGKLVNEFSRLFRDITAIFDHLIDQDDYHTVIEFVSKVKCEQVQQYEEEFKVAAPFPRPKGCKSKFNN
jgi:hypothetical protein